MHHHPDPHRRREHARDSARSPSPIQIFTPEGEYQRASPPKLIASMDRQNMGSATAWVLRHGFLWKFVAHTGFHGKQGLYWRRENDLWRVDDGAIVVRQALSLDGCRLYYGRIGGNSALLPSFKSHLQNHLINFCGEMHKCRLLH
jgi:hypothetical protein